MTFKKQLNTIKENWLLALALLVLVALPMFSGNGLYQTFNAMDSMAGGYAKGIMAESAIASRSYGMVDQDFAPEEEERQITKTSRLKTEVELGQFESKEQQLKAIIKSTDSYLLNENVYKQESGWKEYFRGTYQIKIDSSKYVDVVSQLKGLGEIKSFTENAQDVTGRYTNLKTELDAEKGRLARYESMYAEAERVEDKITLNDRIYNQERRIKYLEDSINNIDNRVEYSTVYFTMNEKQSEYANITLVKISALVKSLVNSINNLFYLIFWAIPYAVALLIILGVRKLLKKRR